ncbi:SGNH/GDSL hydrolase family protein [uncultured Bacteroides sp.]|uniref:SGNH/GDSL hydrolase family protein n=1 Tax=uncultured Bacteroides sp. TaxID=162156 RepID=UPI0025F3197C|nr:SGNH/GDSL hydrolase family protein [uncultured Bacteroides sp.]
MKILKNHLIYSLALVLVVFAALIGLHWLPPITFDGHKMRRVDLLSDIRYPEPEPAVADSDSIPLLPVVKPVFVDTCRTGMTCIEDYCDSTLRGMTPFYEALDRISSDDSDDPMVRIAVFGDSFIEADIFTADLREMLQKRFGGCGVGFVTITSMTSGFRPTVRHAFGGWASHAVTDIIDFDRKKQGISGHYFVPRSGAYVELRGQSKYASLLDTCQRTSIFFYNKDSVHLSASINRGEKRNYSLAPSGGLQDIEIDGRIGSIRWTVDRADSTLFYGLAMDGKKGIILDNFSLRGSSGLSLRGIPQQMLKEFNRQRPYDLIILEYGLNVATQRGRNYDNYQKGLLTAINHLKDCFPQAGILLLSVGDRDYKTENGELHTMPGVKNLIRYQQNIAAESGIAFWNMFEAMGGDGSMADLVHAKPSMANYDYTHINFRGGKHLAGLLYETLIYGKEQYDRRRAYEKE